MTSVRRLALSCPRFLPASTRTISAVFSFPGRAGYSQDHRAHFDQQVSATGPRGVLRAAELDLRESAVEDAFRPHLPSVFDRHPTHPFVSCHAEFRPLPDRPLEAPMPVALITLGVASLSGGRSVGFCLPDVPGRPCDRRVLITSFAAAAGIDVCLPPPTK